MRYLLLLALALSGCEPVATRPAVTDTEPVVLAFHAKWCGYCRSMYPVWERLDRTHEVQWIDTDKSNLDEKYGVTTVPTTVILREGKPPVKIVGIARYERIDQYLRE